MKAAVVLQRDNGLGESEKAFLDRFEAKIIDDLAIAIIDPASDQDDLTKKTITAAIKLGCNPVQAALEAARRATATLTTTRRHEGFFGAACGDLYFDLDQAKASLKHDRKVWSRQRPSNWRA